MIFCEAGVMKAAKGNWNWAYYLKLAAKLKNEFQKNQNYMKVGRFCTQNDDIIFEPSVKSNSKTSKPMLQGVERLTGLVHCLQESLSPLYYKFKRVKQ